MRNLWSQIFVLMVFGLVAGLHAQQAAPAVDQTAPAVPTAQATPDVSAAPTAALVQQSSLGVAAPYGEISGLVKSGNTPLPGVLVSAANTLTGKKYFTSTDVDGTFKISVGGKGRYVVRAEFSAFAPVTQEILLNDQNRSGKADMAMVLLSRAQKNAEQEQRQQIAQQLGGRAGMQQLRFPVAAILVDWLRVEIWMRRRWPAPAFLTRGLRPMAATNR